MTPIEIIEAATIGAAAGLLGGLAGIGGSMVMLPGLHLLLGDEPASVHHLYMAAAMTVNVAVALPAAVGHSQAGAVRRDLLKPLLASTLVFLVAGVLASNLVDGSILKLTLAGFIAAYCVWNFQRVLARHQEADGGERIDRSRLFVAGSATGLVGGLLGLGGGVMLVPILQLLCGVKLKQAIATSSAVICVTALIGAGLKLATLGEHGQPPLRALYLAGLMAPTAMIGARIGAWLTHVLPIQAVRVAITLILIAAVAGMVGLW